MRTSVSESSLVALHEHLMPSGKLGRQQEAIVNWLKDNPGWRSRREISLGTGIEPGAVAGRVNSLVAAGRVQESDLLDRCPISGRSVKKVRTGS